MASFDFAYVLDAVHLIYIVELLVALDQALGEEQLLLLSYFIHAALHLFYL